MKIKTNTPLKILVAFGLVLTLAVGITTATLTEDVDINSHLLFNQVRIELISDDYSNKVISPGETVNFNTSIKNLGQDCYVRIKIETITTFDGDKVKPENINGVNSADWVNGTDENVTYLYYKNILKKDASVLKSFNSITFPSSWGNNTSGSVPQIKVTAEAIQSKNTIVDFDSNSPWGENIKVVENIE